ncbi:MAG: hypothetical protein FRX49_04781 [Trebouxia sp. A1-2]|nr:MAG: hypothetical protein FRX49_04781 [Trebouxia sp. A1-2]
MQPSRSQCGLFELQRKQADRQAKELAASTDQETLEVLKRSVNYLAGAVNHQKARAIFLDPGEGDTESLEALRAAFLDDSVLGKSEDTSGIQIPENIRLTSSLLAELIVTCLKDLSEPLVTSKLSGDLLTHLRAASEGHVKLYVVKCLLEELPDQQHEALKALICLLAALAQHHTKNGMSAIMLGQALGPLLFRPGQDDRALGSGDVASWVESAVEGTAEMIKHCGNLFGGYFGGDTNRSYRPQTYQQHSHRQDHTAADPFSMVTDPVYAHQHQPGPKRMVSLIAGMHEQQPWGSENQSMGPGSLNSTQHAQQAQQQKAARKLAGSKPAAIDVDTLSSHSSESAGSRSAGTRGRTGSLPASPSRRRSTVSDRGSKDAPWLQGRQFGQVEKALQKNKIRLPSPTAESAATRTAWRPPGIAPSKDSNQLPDKVKTVWAPTLRRDPSQASDSQGWGPRRTASGANSSSQSGQTHRNTADSQDTATSGGHAFPAASLRSAHTWSSGHLRSLASDAATAALNDPAVTRLDIQEGGVSPWKGDQGAESNQGPMLGPYKTSGIHRTLSAGQPTGQQQSMQGLMRGVPRAEGGAGRVQTRKQGLLRQDLAGANRQMSGGMQSLLTPVQDVSPQTEAMALLDALNGSNVKRPGAKQLSPLEQRQIGTMRMAGLATGMLPPCEAEEGIRKRSKQAAQLLAESLDSASQSLRSSPENYADSQSRSGFQSVHNILHPDSPEANSVSASQGLHNSSQKTGWQDVDSKSAGEGAGLEGFLHAARSRQGGLFEAEALRRLSQDSGGAQQSGRLSDSDVYAITHAESAAESVISGKGACSAQPAALRGLDQMPALLQLQALADADAITPQGKQPHGLAGAVAGSPQLTRPAAISPQGQQLPGLSRLRALAGVTDSPQPPSQLKKTAGNLTDLAGVPLSQWQFGNSGTSHAVWQADSTPPKQAGAHSTADRPSAWTSAQSESASAQHESLLSRAGSAASPTAWGPSEPPQPVTLEIRVLGDGDNSDTDLRSSKEGLLQSSTGEKDTAHAESSGVGVSGFGFEAGFGSQHLGVAARDQPRTAAATKSAAVTEATWGKDPLDSTQAGVHAAGSFADGKVEGQAVHPGMSTRQQSAGISAYQAKQQPNSTGAGAFPDKSTTTEAQRSTVTDQSQLVNPAKPHRPQHVGSSGAADLTEAAAGMTGSPWDPKQGPKLIESLNDFSSFSGSFSMLQQLAGKSAAGVAHFGIGRLASSSSPKSLEKKKSDKGHLISSAPLTWWQRHRPGSAKKRSTAAAPQGSGARPGAPAGATGDHADHPPTCFSAPDEGAKQGAGPASAKTQSVRLTADGSHVSGHSNEIHSSAAAQTAAASGRHANAGQYGSRANNGRGTTEQHQGSSVGDATNSIVYNLETADRPLSSFKQAAGHSLPGPRGLPQAGQPAADTAGHAMYADGIAYSNQPILAGSGESQIAVGAEAARVDAHLASAVASSGRSSLTGTPHKGQLQVPQQEGQLAEPSPESTPLPSRGSKAPQGFAGFHHGVHASNSPIVQNLWPTSVGPSSPQGQHPPRSVPIFGYSVQQEMEMPTTHADKSGRQPPGAAPDAGHVASGPAPGGSRQSALNQLYALAQGSSVQQEGTVATAVAASPAVSASVGEAMDLNKAPFTVSQMRKFADKLRNFSTTPTPESRPSKGHRHRRHSTLSASAAHSSGAHTPAASSSAARDSATHDSSWAANLMSPEFAPQKLLGQFGNSPHCQGTGQVPGHAIKHHRHHQAETTSAVADSSALHVAHPAVADIESAVATTDAAAATAGLRQGSEGQMMLLPAGVAMNDLLALAEEMDPGGSPEEGKRGRRDKRMLTANSTMQLAAYLAGKILENTAFRKLATTRSAAISLVEHRRAHNICIELSGIRMPFADIKTALVQMNDSALTIDQLDALSRAVPDDTERKDIRLYLQGEHPKHKGLSDPQQLGTVERYFLEIMDIPRLQQRIDCFIFTRQFVPNINRVRGQLEVLRGACREVQGSQNFTTLLRAILALGNHLNEGTHKGNASGFKLDTLLKLADVKGTDRKTSLLHFVLDQLLKDSPAMHSLPHQLASVKPAANLQISAIKVLLNDLKGGLSKVNTEILKAAGVDANSAFAHRQFGDLMMTFHEHAKSTFADAEEFEKQVTAEMQQVTEYFGEGYDATDPSKVLRVIRDFMTLFDKAILEIKAIKAKSEAEQKRKEKKAEMARPTWPAHHPNLGQLAPRQPQQGERQSADLAASDAQQATAGAFPRAAAHVPAQQQAEAFQPHAHVEAVPSSSSQAHPQAQASSSDAIAYTESSFSNVLLQQVSTDAGYRPDSQPPSAFQQTSLSSSAPPQAPLQAPSSASAAPAKPPSALSQQHPHSGHGSQSQRAESACHESPPSAPASSESKLQLRLDSGRSAHSQQAEAGVSGRSQRPSPPQELLAGLGNALRAQAKMRQKASGATTPSSAPEDRGDSARRAAASPSGQLSFDHDGLKSKSTSGLNSADAAASPSGRAGVIAVAPGSSRLSQKVALDPACSQTDDAFDAQLIASHAPAVPAGSFAQASCDHVQVQANNGQNEHTQKVHASEVTGQLAHSGPSIELVGSELYELELEHESDVLAARHAASAATVQ